MPVRVVIMEPACGNLRFDPPSEEIALAFFEWAKAKGFKVSIANALDLPMLNSRLGQSLVEAITNQFQEDFGAGRDTEG